MPSIVVARVTAQKIACHIGRMEQKHPHADAAYRVVRQADETYAVEVAVPDSNPTMVTSFTTAAKAEAWISAHKERVARTTSLSLRRWQKR